jgi:hypothetical protein
MSSRPPSANSYAEIKSITGNAFPTSLRCPKCISAALPNVQDVKGHTEFFWAVTVCCANCSTVWHVCKLCDTGMRRSTQFMDKNGLYNHNYKKHREGSIVEVNKKRKLNVASIESSDNCIVSDTDVAMTSTSSNSIYFSIVNKHLSKPSFGHFQKSYNVEYFKQQQLGDFGASYLVGLSNFNVKDVVDIKPVEIQMHLNIAALTSTMTRGQREQLATILKDTADVAVQQSHLRGADRAWMTKIPTTPGDIRSLYIEGKCALLPNLPRPEVTVVDDHAYVSLKDCVADLLGHGFELDIIEPISCNSHIASSITQTKFAKRILGNAATIHSDVSTVICLYLTEWSDGFEPASSKSNRQSCWIKTVTISAPANRLHSLSHTYPIAIGYDGHSHEQVEERFASELMGFRNGKSVSFYHGGVKKNVLVYLELFVSLQDQPERRSANFIMLGGGRFTARWGHAVDLAAIVSGVPACSKCIVYLTRDTTEGREPCVDCVNWDTEVKNGLLDFDPPTDFPTDELPASGKLSPLRLTYEVMKCAVTTAHERFLAGGWSKKNIASYLRVHGLNNEAITAITDCSVHCKDYNDALALSNDKGVEMPEDLLACKLQNPELFTQWKFPSLWDRGVQLDQHIDVAMHLIFLGVVKTCIIMVQEWTKRRGKHAAFLRYVSGSLEEIQRLGLDWCRCVTYKTGKLGGWVSENYLGVTRVLHWLYCCIDDIAADEVFETPLRNQRLWNLKENRGWLSIRGQDTKGNAEELRCRVKLLMDAPEGPPPVLPPQGGPANNVINVITCLRAMVSRLMKRSISEDDVLDAERHIKLFLSAFDIFDKGMRTDSEEKPTWMTSYNFICLTNLPGMLRKFGPIRNLWEGGGQGEKVIGLLKPLWNGYRMNWHKNLLDNVLKRMAIDRVQQACFKSQLYNDDKELDNDVIDETNNNYRKMAHRYKTFEMVVSDFESRKPLSVVHLQDGRFVCLLRDRASVAILTCGDYIENRGGAFYHNWSIGQKLQLTKTDEAALSEVLGYCLLLPKMTVTGMPSSENMPIFTLVESEWMDIHSDSSLSVPKIPDVTYS